MQKQKEEQKQKVFRVTFVLKGIVIRLCATRLAGVLITDPHHLVLSGRLAKLEVALVCLIRGNLLDNRKLPPSGRIIGKSRVEFWDVNSISN